MFIFKNLIKNHKQAIFFAILVGLIYIAPHIIFISSLGDKFQGIPMMKTANEDFYLGRIREILDGHPAIGSFAFYEYKEQWPLSPPTGEFLYALPARLFGVPPFYIVIAGRYILPAILFLLVYALIGRLTGGLLYFSHKLNAMAGSLWVTLGYDLIDFRNVWNFLAGKQDTLAGGFLIWSRPVNPILGAILLFTFLFLLLVLWQKTRSRRTAIILAGLSLALMISSYFFSWGMALSIWGVLLLVALIKREWSIVRDFLWVLLTALFFSLPYWYVSFKASQSPWYADSALRSGLFYTHYPLINKLLLAVLALYLFVALCSILNKNRPIIFSGEYLKKLFNRLEAWHWFCLAFILGALWAYSQQIITGATIWPYHFVQYSIPLAIIVIMVSLFNALKEKLIYLWSGAAALIAVSCLFYGIYAQAGVYQKNYSTYAEMQSYDRAFSWLNEQAKDCAVLVKHDAEKAIRFDKLIPAMTHCNSFIITDGIFSLMPNERIIFNYLTFLRLKNIDPEKLESYLAENDSEARSRLFSNWKGLYGVKDFPDFSDKLLAERIKKLPGEYREFMKKDFKTELKKYRLDYILSVGPLSELTKKELPDIDLAKETDGFFIYKFMSGR